MAHFSCIYWPVILSVCFYCLCFWKVIVHIIWPLLLGLFEVFKFSFKSLFMLCISVHQMYSRRFSSLCWLSPHLCFLAVQKPFNFDITPFISSWYYFMSPCLLPIFWDVFSVVSSNSFKVSGLPFWVGFYSGLDRGDLVFIFLHLGIQFSSHRLLKRASFLQCIVLASLSRWFQLCGFAPGPVLYWSLCLSLYQYSAVFVTEAL